MVNISRCGCAGSTCNCLIEAGEGITVTGSGTVNDAYIISASGVDISDSIQFIDTATVNFTVTGSGTDANPYQIKADAQISLAELSNVTCSSPSNGQTIIWNGTSWVCGKPSMALNDLTDVTAPSPVTDGYVLAWNGTAWVPTPPNTVDPATIVTADPITGDGTAAAPIGLDLVTDDSLKGDGTAASPLGWQIIYAAGTAEVVGARPGDPATLAVTFPAGRFADTPFITLGMYTSVPGERFPGHINKTSNGFTMVLGYTGLSDSATVWISWHAFVRPGSGDDPTVFEQRRRLNPLLEIISPHDAVTEVPEDGLATCHVIGCDNQNVPIPVHTTWVDELGVTRQVGGFQCGVCSQPITDVQGVS